MDSTSTPIVGFDKALEELSRFGDSLELREKQLKEKHAIELDQQKKKFNGQLQKERKRIEQLQKTNRTLAKQMKQMTGKQIDLNQTCTTLNKKYLRCQDGLEHYKWKCCENDLKIQRLEKDISILKDDQINLKTEHQNLLDQIKETPSQSTSDEYIQLAEKAGHENQKLKKKLTERNNHIVRLNEQLYKLSKEVEQRIVKLKHDFRIMYDQQSEFFFRKVTLLKEQHSLNNAKLDQYNL